MSALCRPALCSEMNTGIPRPMKVIHTTQILCTFSIFADSERRAQVLRCHLMTDQGSPLGLHALNLGVYKRSARDCSLGVAYSKWKPCAQVDCRNALHGTPGSGIGQGSSRTLTKMCILVGRAAYQVVEVIVMGDSLVTAVGPMHVSVQKGDT